MKILILGHRGMLGSQLLDSLSHHYDVVGKDIDAFDITSEESCRDVVKETQPDVVVNAAAYTDVDGSESKKDLCFAVNAEGVKHIALACRPDKIKIVHFSTDYVFDGTKTTPYHEDDPCHPLNVYGNAKLAGERNLQQHSDHYLIIRTAWLYGRNGQNFVKTILKKAGEGELLQVVDDQKGAPTYVKDLAAAVERLLKESCTGIVHVTNRGACTWYEFAVKILEYAGISDIPVKKISSGLLPRPAARPSNSVLSCSKFIGITGRAMRFWQLALYDFIDRERMTIGGKIY